MSVRERVIALRQEKFEELQRAKEKEEAAEKDLSKRRKEELPQAIKEVNSKRLRFKRLGLLEVVEELVEAKIEPLQNPYEALKPKKYRPPTAKDLEDLINPIFHMGRYSIYNAGGSYTPEILTPTIENDVWDTDLKIKIHLTGDYISRVREGKSLGKSYPWVDVVFDNNILTVSGERPQRVPLGYPFNRAQRIEAFEDALAQAILSPQRPPQEPPNLHYPIIFGVQA